VKFPTGGDEGNLLVRDPVSTIENGGFGEIPKPTVKVWMGEGMTSLRKKCIVLRFFGYEFLPRTCLCGALFFLEKSIDERSM
jgi:hypothetical protein